MARKMKTTKIIIFITSIILGGNAEALSDNHLRREMSVVREIINEIENNHNERKDLRIVPLTKKQIEDEKNKISLNQGDSDARKVLLEIRIKILEIKNSKYENFYFLSIGNGGSLNLPDNDARREIMQLNMKLDSIYSSISNADNNQNINVSSKDYVREKQKSDEAGRKFEEEKSGRAQAINNQRINLQVNNTQANAEGDFVISIQTGTRYCFIKS
jgi:hypothetical protein